MKKIVFTLVCTLLIFVLCACSSVTPRNAETQVSIAPIPEETTAETPSTEPENIVEEIPAPDPDLPVADFTALLSEFSANHKEMVENDLSQISIDEYLINDEDSANLLSKEEIQELMTSVAMPYYVTYEEAAYDVDTLFRAIQSAYGAYYYIGEDTFSNAKADIMNWLKGQNNVNTTELAFKLSRVFSTIRDAHMTVQTGIREDPLRLKYYHTDHLFAMDDKGYYQCYNGEKWYADSFSDSGITMEYTLTHDGRILYSPVLFCLPDEMSTGTLTIRNAQGKTRELTLIWAQGQSFDASNRRPDFQYLEENGVAYISVRSFLPFYEQNGLKQFTATGAEVRDAKLIIFDIRANEGGSDRYSKEWIQKFCGQIPQYSIAFTTRSSPLYRAWLSRENYYSRNLKKEGTFSLTIDKGKQLANQIPIIVLVDDTCGSSGESMLNNLRCLDNVMIIGSNSAGYQMCGNQMHIWLPNSNVECCFGASLQFTMTTENVDYKGYAPDIWCDPVNSLDWVFNMLQYYDLTDVDTLQALKSNIPS